MGVYAAFVMERNVTNVPASPDDYKADLPAEYAGRVRIDVNDARFKAAQKLAHDARLSQDQFSKALGVEAQRILAAASARAASTAAAPRELSTIEKFGRAISRARNR